MRLRKAAGAAGVLALVATTAALAPGAPATASSSGPDIRVGSFNITTVSGDYAATGDRKTWKVRRAHVVSEVMDQHLDVLGVQEANQSTVYGKQLVDGRTQYLDLRNGLNTAGGHYALTASAAYNCVRPFSKYKCRYRYRGASGDNRILYNTSTLSLVSAGGYRYPHQTRGKADRFLAWARLRVKATGQDFLFTTTHLDPYTKSVKIAEWHDLIAKVNQLKGSLPVVVTGDFNTSKYSAWAAQMLPAMVSNGYGDALGQRYEDPTSRRPQSLTNAWINSFNGFRRNVAAYGWGDHSRTGNGIDWIFTSNNLTVPEFEVVVDMNPDTLQLNGVIPSDHNLVRATIRLP